MALHRFRVTGVVYVFRHRRNALRHRFIGDDISVDAIAEVDGKIAVSFLGLGESLLSLTSPMMRYTSSGGRAGIEKFVEGVLIAPETSSISGSDVRSPNAKQGRAKLVFRVSTV